MEPKTSEDVTAQIEALRQRVAELERAQGEQKRMEGAVQDSQERANAYLESASEGIAIVDRHGRIVLVNAKTESMFGYRRDELLGRSLEILLPEHLRAIHERHRAAYFADPRVRPMGQGLELTARRRDGTVFPVEISLSFVDTERGVEAIAFVTDITGRKRAEEALRKSEVRARAYLESASEGIVIVDERGRIVSVNARTEHMFGYARDELAGRTLELLVPERLRDLHARHRAGYFADPRVRSMGRGLDLTGRRKDGTEFPVEISLSYVGTEEGVQAVGFITDITERLAVERAARQAERLASLGTLSAGIAHEINNPVGIMSSRIELMLMEAESQRLPGEVVEDLRVLHRNAMRVVRIAQSLLSLARESPGEREPVDLNRVVEETLLLIERQMGKEGIQISTQLDRTLPMVLGHGNALQQVVLNLLTNAREAMAGEGELRVETGPAPENPGAVRLKVTDTGPGIAPEVLPKIFDPFYTTKPAGTGLGLSVTYGIIRDHRGTVDVQSDPGKGTTFILTFPAFRGEGPHAHQ